MAQGLAWLLAALLFIAAAGALYVWPRWWWLIGAAAVAVSMPIVLSSWADAWVGALTNLLVLAGVIFGYVAHGPGSLRAAYDGDVARRVSHMSAAPVLTDGDLATLPDPVQRYIRQSGAVGQPRIRNYRVRMHGRIRSGPDARWMPFSADQHSFVDDPARLFYMEASMRGLPVFGIHRYVGEEAMMRIKAAGLVPVVDLAGNDMTRAETVTLFNDLCIMAPGALVEPAISWEAVDAQSVRATFTNGGHSIRAELQFNDAGELIDFWSDDRLAAQQTARR